MYYPCSENKGADQLCSYCTADLRLCFRIAKNRVFTQKPVTGPEQRLNVDLFSIKCFSFISLSFLLFSILVLLFYCQSCIVFKQQSS